MKKLFGITLALLMICSGVVALPAAAGEPGDDPAWTIYFRPAVRFGTDDRTLYIMDFIVPLYEGEKNLLFFNPRFTPNDVNGWETNLGLGYRHLLFNDKLILGANVYYDMRHTGWGTDHDQIGFGFEAMTEINKYVALTGRFNYYIPLTDPIITGTPGGGGYVLRDQGIYSLGGGLVEESLEGFDAELGFRVPFISDYVETWIYGGGYHYSGDYIKNINGWTARFEIVPTDFVRLNYEYREDRTNHGEHYGEVMFEVPFSIGNLVAGKNPFEGFGKRFGGSRDMKTRLNEPVRRDVDITVKTVETQGPGGAEGTLAAGVIFVSDDGVDAPGNGSYENPYASINYALDNLGGDTIIHVMNRIAGTLAGATIDVAGITIWGSGTANPEYPVISNFTAGTYPTIGGAITVDASAPNVTLMGLDIVSTGVSLTINNPIGAVVQNNIMYGGGSNPVLLCSFNNGSSETSPLIIEGNELYNNSGSDSMGGIVVDGPSYDVFARITGNHIETAAYTFNFGIIVESGANVGSATHPVIISGNDITTTTVSNRAWSVYLVPGYSGTGGTAFAEITGNHIVNSASSAGGGLDPNAIIWLGNKYGTTGYIGTVSNPVVISGNYGTISGNSSGRVFVYVRGNGGGGNGVNWGGIGTGTGNNNFTVTGPYAGWGFGSSTSPIYTDNLGSGNSITP